MKGVKGTFDILPWEYQSDGNSYPASSTWTAVEANIREVFRLAGFKEIRTPVIEPLELVKRGVGAETDIVSKEMFVVPRTKESYVLRPELTAPVVRAYAQHSMGQQGQVQRLFYIGPCFRAERPQKGRYRQFHQFGVELLGTDHFSADAETIIVMHEIYQSMGIENGKLLLNSLGDKDTRARYRAKLVEYFEPFSDELSETSKTRLEKNPLRILDTKNEREIELVKNAPKIIDLLSDEDRDHYAGVKRLLDNRGINYEEDPYLVRGLDYYGRTTFELLSPDLGAQSALAGGGRYDALAQSIGLKKEIPAVGFAAGMERLLIAMGSKSSDEKATIELFIIANGHEAETLAAGIESSLRSSGKSCLTDSTERSHKAKMRESSRQNSRLVLVLDSNDNKPELRGLRDMSEGEDISLDGIEAELGPLINFLLMEIQKKSS